MFLNFLLMQSYIKINTDFQICHKLEIAHIVLQASLAKIQCLIHLLELHEKKFYSFGSWMICLAWL